MIFRRLTKEIATEKKEEILGLEKDIKNIGGPNWTEENLLKDLPMKWDLSFILEGDAGEIIGYVIASNQNRRYHIHRPFLHPSYRKKRTLWLIREAVRTAKANSFTEVSWKAGTGIETLPGSFRIADRWEKVEGYEKGLEFYVFYKDIGDITP